MALPRLDLRVFATAAEAASAAAQWIDQLLGPLKEPAALVLAGGRTPRELYRLLAGKSLPWEYVALLPSDERCLPDGHPDRNDVILERSLVGRLPRGAAAFHRIPAGLGPEEGANALEKVLEILPPIAVGVMGLGEDGHTAGLFPGDPALDSTRGAAPVLAAPKPPARRVTLTIRTLNRAAHLVFLVTGAGKQEALARWRAGEAIPAARLYPGESLTVFCDPEAYGPGRPGWKA